MVGLYHRIIVFPEGGNVRYRFDETLNDYVYTMVNCFFSTRYMDNSNIIVGRLFSLILPPPNPNTFIPFVNVDFRVMRQWIDENVNVVAIQRELTTELDAKIAAMIP